MSGTVHEYPSDEEILAGVERERGIQPYARTIGVSASTFRGYLEGRGLAEDARAAAKRGRESDRAARAAERAVAPSAPLPDEEVSREEKLEQRVKELEAAVRKVRQEAVRDERVIDAISDIVPKVSVRYSPDVIPKHTDRELDDHEMVLLFSDTHAGETVSAEETLGMNEYDWDIMLRRMGKIQKSVLDFQENRPYRIPKLHVWELGDMLSGDIHEELKTTNDRPMAEATVQMGLDTAAWLKGFAPYFDEIDVAGVPGNHPRATKKPSAKEAHNNGDWIAYKIQELALRDDDQFTFNFPRSAYATVTVADQWRCLLMHGDGIRSTMPGVPWGGVVRRITVLQQQFARAKQPLDYIALGHFHTANAIEGVGTKTFLNGSVKGVDEYSLRQFGSGRPPMQLLLTFHKKWGVTDVSYIDLEPVEPAQY